MHTFASIRCANVAQRIVTRFTRHARHVTQCVTHESTRHAFNDTRHAFDESTRTTSRIDTCVISRDTSHIAPCRVATRNVYVGVNSTMQRHTTHCGSIHAIDAIVTCACVDRTRVSLIATCRASIRRTNHASMPIESMRYVTFRDVSRIAHNAHYVKSRDIKS